MAVTTAIVAGSVVGAASSAYGAKKAGKVSQQATDATIGEQRRQYDQTRADYQPFMQTGYAANREINQLYGRTTNPDGTVTSGGAPNMAGFFTSPDYQFNLAEGQKAINNSAVAQGGLLSGGAVKAGMRYASGLASQQFGDFYNRLAGQAGLGQTAAGAVANAGSNSANNISNAYMNNAQVRGSAYMAGAQGANNAVQGGLSNFLLSKYLGA